MGIPEFVTGCVLWVIVGVLVFSTWNMAFWEKSGAPGPRFFPILIAIALSLLTIAYWIGAYLNRGKGIVFPKFANLKKPALFCGIVLLTVALWDTLGAIPMVLLASVLELRFLEGYAWKRSLIVTAILTVGSYVLFEMIFGIRLPWGIFRHLM